MPSKKRAKLWVSGGKSGYGRMCAQSADVPFVGGQLSRCVAKGDVCAAVIRKVRKPRVVSRAKQTADPHRRGQRSAGPRERPTLSQVRYLAGGAREGTGAPLHGWGGALLGWPCEAPDGVSWAYGVS